MEPVEKELTKCHIESNTKRPSFFKRLRRRFTLVFHRRAARSRNKTESQIPDTQETPPKIEEVVNLSSSLTNEHCPDIVEEDNETGDSIEPIESNFRPPAKVPLFINDFTNELKQSLKLRSRKIEEGDKSPTDAIQQIENLRSLSTISYEDKTDVKIEIETKTFEEKLALFESQISGGSESFHDTLKRGKSENVGSVEENKDNGSYDEKDMQNDGRQEEDKAKEKDSVNGDNEQDVEEEKDFKNGDNTHDVGEEKHCKNGDNTHDVGEEKHCKNGDNTHDVREEKAYKNGDNTHDVREKKDYKLGVKVRDSKEEEDMRACDVDDTKIGEKNSKKEDDYEEVLLAMERTVLANDGVEYAISVDAGSPDNYNETADIDNRGGVTDLEEKYIIERVVNRGGEEPAEAGKGEMTAKTNGNVKEPGVQVKQVDGVSDCAELAANQPHRGPPGQTEDT